MSGGVQFWTDGSHAEMHTWLLPLGLQTCLLPMESFGQVTPKQGSATQKLATHVLPSGHGNSPGMHGAAHWQFVHCVPPGQSEPSSTLPSQSSSVQLQLSWPTGVPTHTTMPFTHCCMPAQI